METSTPSNAFDRDVRLFIYDYFLRTGRAPQTIDVAAKLSCGAATVHASLERLAAGHAIVLEPESREILRAAPFWATPTNFVIESSGRSWWGSCIWDALGIPAMLGADARVLTACGCCSAAMTLEVSGGVLQPAEGIVHFAVPVPRWYEDVVFT